jgi:hypothetical protein
VSVLFCLGGVFQSLRVEQGFGGVAHHFQPRYDAVASLAAAASLVKVCINIIAKSIEWDDAQADLGGLWDAIDTGGDTFSVRPRPLCTGDRRPR